MRTAFHDRLDKLTCQLAAMCGMVAVAMEKATRALLEADLGLAEEVIKADTEIDALRLHSEEAAYALLALQAPVAGDLRSIVTHIHVSEKVERMGDLARHVAEQARRRYPEPAIPAQTRDRFAEMGRLAVVAARQVQQLIATPGRTGYAELNEADDLIDALEQNLLASLSRQDWQHGVRAGIDVALLARFYERFADQAVSVARRLDYAATGTLPGAHG
ncbi:phosphate signaling complex protein PhoU [Amycolatopsis sp. K13G38]|uniref:Phosphate-specific transport system accessory protein PhoU n=1 Tax=Amycolatopsis acididurans TaxID=2724524 RepID=A0ABX1IZC6_9PSEU|nr:phosphate signaling complex protein PhoU [Amycolatopsis acididurans]NKQ52868.1 phosphate signaling complex protein PhoU [Amycolatopsis acididurans]